jgi:hypothetical protein
MTMKDALVAGPDQMNSILSILFQIEGGPDFSFTLSQRFYVTPGFAVIRRGDIPERPPDFFPG